MSDFMFIEEVAAGTPTPGGGGAAAYCGALGSALVSMVGNLTVGKAAYAPYEAEIKQRLSELLQIREDLLGLIERDAAAFAPLAAAYKLPRTSEDEKNQRHQIIQAALIDAIEVPAAIMSKCARVIELSDYLAYHGTSSAISDVACGVIFAKAAMQGAVLNVYVNAKLMDNREQAQRYVDEADRLLGEYSVRADEIYAYVRKEIS